MQPKPRTLLEAVRDAIRIKHYSYRTEKSYINWIKRYIRFHDWQHPREMGGLEIEAFLTAFSRYRKSSRIDSKSSAECFAVSVPYCSATGPGPES